MLHRFEIKFHRRYIADTISEMLLTTVVKKIWTCREKIITGKIENYMVYVEGMSWAAVMKRKRQKVFLWRQWVLQLHSLYLFEEKLLMVET